jgi:hypothetical protein
VNIYSILSIKAQTYYTQKLELTPELSDLPRENAFGNIQPKLHSMVEMIWIRKLAQSVTFHASNVDENSVP